jgi:hypothetical protein
MTSIQIDRTDGLSSSTAIKGPVKCAAISNITLSAEQTIDGVAVVDGDRVLVVGQTNAADNGIWKVSTGVWSRAKDFSSNRDVKRGTLVLATAGTSNSGLWEVTAANPISIGATAITFAAFGGFAGPISSVADNIVTFADTTGKVGKDSGVAVTSLAPKANPTFSGTVTLGQDPAAALQAATKQYVDNLALNVGKRGRVRVASTANLTLSAPGSTIDGVAMSAGNLFLAKDQSAPAENGIYVWNGSALAATRSTEFDTYDEHPGSLIAVQAGTVNADTLWLCTSNEGGTLGTTAIAFSGVGIALLDGSVTYAKIASAAVASASDYRGGTATGKLLTVDQVNAAMAEVTLTDAATIAWDMATGIDFTVTLGGNRTLGNPTNTVVGRRGRIRVVQDGTGSRTLTKSSNHKTAGGAALSIASAAAAETYLYYDCVSSTKILLSNSSLAWS